MTDSLLIPRAELEALLAKLENSQLDYAERVGRAQGYIDRWLIMAPKVAEREAVAPCVNCGKEMPRIDLMSMGLCKQCYYNCICPNFAGESDRCPVHSKVPANGDTSDAAHVAAAQPAQAKLGVIA